MTDFDRIFERLQASYPGEEVALKKVAGPGALSFVAQVGRGDTVDFGHGDTPELAFGDLRRRAIKRADELRQSASELQGRAAVIDRRLKNLEAQSV